MIQLTNNFFENILKLHPTEAKLLLYLLGLLQEGPLTLTPGTKSKIRRHFKMSDTSFDLYLANLDKLELIKRSRKFTALYVLDYDESTVGRIYRGTASVGQVQ